MKYKLSIKTDNGEVNDLYKDHGIYNEEDSGLDLFIPEDIEIRCGETKKVNLKIKCEMFDTSLDIPKNVPYLLYARSSIVKTPLMLKNSTGIIDSGYRGNLIAAFYYSPTTDDLLRICSNPEDIPVYKIDKGTRLVQICSTDYISPHFDLVNDLTESQRGEQGIGSTGL